MTTSELVFSFSPFFFFHEVKANLGKISLKVNNLLRRKHCYTQQYNVFRCSFFISCRIRRKVKCGYGYKVAPIWSFYSYFYCNYTDHNPVVSQKEKNKKTVYAL